MTTPLFFRVTETSINNTNNNLSLIKPASSKNNIFGGITFQHYFLPDNLGGTVVVSNRIGGDYNIIYNTPNAVLQHMALLYNSHGKIVTPNYSSAITDVDEPFNFAGLALTSTTESQYFWNEKLPSLSPPSRYYSQMVFNIKATNITLFGGFNGTVLSDTWTWDGSNWTQIHTVTNPAARAGHAMTYDHANDKIVMYGGIDVTNTTLAETWTWNTLNWTNQSNGVPGRLKYHAIAYDGYRHVSVLFGGQNSSNVSNNSTWEWNGSTWSSISTVTHPSIRYAHCMGFDEKRNRTVLFGGINNNITNGETWEYDGINWIQINIPTTRPSPRSYATMTYDPIKRVVVMFGGIDDNLNSLNDSWQYDGIQWNKIAINGEPSVRSGSIISYDTSNNTIVMFGGANQSLGADGDTWTLQNSIAPIILQAAGDGYVYYDATGIWPIKSGSIIRTGSTTVTITTAIPHTFSNGDSFILTPGETNFPAGTKTIISIIDGYNFSYTESGSNISNTSPEIVHTLTARPVPAINDFLGPSLISGTVSSTADGYSPVFGYAIEAPVIDNTGALYQTTINGSQVGIIKMRIEPFIGFIPPVSATITDFIPTFGHVGDAIVINGAGFLGAIQITFDGYPSTTSTFSTISNNQLLITVPSNAKTGTISVTTILGTNTSIEVFHVVPIILNIVAPIHAIGDSVIILGHTFTNISSISFNGTNQPIFTINNDTSITTTIPAGATSGTIAVTNPDGVGSFDNFDVIEPPVINSGGLTPTIGAAGSRVAITGSGFTAPGTAMDGYGIITFVKIGGGQTLNTSRIIFDDTQISVLVPAMPGGQGSTGYNIIVTTDGGTTSSTQTFSIIPPPAFLDAPGPTFVPSSGSAGDNIDIYGKYGFSTVSSVYFDGYQSQSLSLITAHSTSGNTNRSGSTVSVTTTANHNFISGNVIFIQPSLDTNFPSDFVTINVGSNNTFTYTQIGSSVSNTVSITFINDSHIKAKVPITPFLNTPIVPISIHGAGGITSTEDAFASGTGVTYPQDFIILLQPIITSFTPNSGSVGTIVQVTGNNFLTADRVFFNSITATANSGQVIRSGSVVSVTTDAYHGFSNGSTILVHSTDSNFNSAFVIINVTSSDAFTYTQVGGAVSNSLAIAFLDTVANAPFFIVNNTQLNATTPGISTGITTGPIIVAANQVFDISSNSFTFIPPPVITNLDKVRGGYGSPPTQVTITGTRLTNTNGSAPLVLVGGQSATIISYNSTTVVIMVPRTSGDNIDLITDGGRSSFIFHVIQEPIIYNSTPTSGCSLVHSANISINGNFFAQANTTYDIFLYFNNFNSVVPLSINNTQIVVDSSEAVRWWNVYQSYVQSITFTIYFFLYYDGGSYQVVSPQTYTVSFCIF